MATQLEGPKKIEWNGKIYRRDNGGHYVFSEKLHRSVWEKHFGPIPEGYVIHHIDEKKHHNGLMNLQILTEKEHRQHHAKDGRLKKGCLHLKKNCPNCQIEFTDESPSNNARFCSNKCSCAYRWRTRNDEKIPQEQRKKICKTCSAEFVDGSRGNNREYCSKKCRNHNSYIKTFKSPLPS